MRRMLLVVLGLCLSASLFAGCANNNDNGPNMKMRTKGDLPLRNDPEWNDRDNRVFPDADRDDTIFDDEDMLRTPGVNNGINGRGNNRNNMFNGNGMNGMNGNGMNNNGFNNNGWNGNNMNNGGTHLGR